MEFPINFHLGGIEIPSHLIFYLLAFFLGFKYYIYLRNKKGDFIVEDQRWVLIIGAMIGALFGSKLLAALESPELFFDPPSFLFYLQGQTIVGGLLGGVIGVELAKKIVGEKRSTGDLFTFPLIFGIIIGRIGCFLTGVSDRTIGVASSLPWAFDQGDGIARHPTSLYEIIFLVCLFFILKKLEQKNLKNGMIFKIFIFSYVLFRFIIEFIKPIVPILLGLSAIQITCLIGIFYFGIQIIYTIKNGKK